MIIGFSTSNSLLSRVIRRLTRSTISHTYFKFRAFDEEVIIHANETGVNLDYYDKFRKKSIIVKEFLVDLNGKENTTISYLIKQLDQPYDYLAAIGSLWVFLNRALGKKVKNPLNKKYSYFCSELLLTALKIADWQGTENLDPHTTFPEDLMQFLNNHPKAKAL